MGTAAQDLNRLCTKSKTGGWSKSQLWENGPFLSTWKAPKSCGEEENSQGLWQGRAGCTHKQGPLLSRRGTEQVTALGGWGQQPGQLTGSCWGTMTQENSRHLTKLAWPKDSQETNTALSHVLWDQEKTGQVPGDGSDSSAPLGTCQQTLTASPGSSEDADGQTEGWVQICDCKVKDFKHHEASGKASLSPVGNQEQGQGMLLQSMPACTTGNGTRIQRYRIR